MSYTETWTDVDGTRADAHTADSGQTYSTNANWLIANNRLYNSDDAGSAEQLLQVLEADNTTPVVTGSEYDLDVDFYYDSDTGDIGVFFAYQDIDNLYMIRMRTSDIQLYTKVAGTFELIDSVDWTGGNTSLVSVTVKVRADTLEVFQGATSVIGPIINTDHARAGQLFYRSAQGSTSISGYQISGASFTNVATATPTITDINTNNEVVPGTTATLTGTNLTGATGFNIGSEAQPDFTVVSDTSVTFTTVRGGNPYNQNLTGTLLHPDGNKTITVQQVPESGTFAVTAASPNTTDDASLWTGLIDTATSNPITIVDGDQAWVKNPNNLTNLAIAPDGTITADQTGDFVVQIWLASEGVWGSDQTVSFTVPGGVLQSIRSTVRSIIQSTIRQTRRKL